MAVSLAGGTDKLRYTQIWPFGGSPSIGFIAFRVKTTDTGANKLLATLWNSSSRLGIGIILNSTANKVTAWCYDVNSPPKVDIVSTTSVNDGNWHSVVLNWNGTSGQANTLYIDGTQEATTNATANWSISGLSIPLNLGDNIDTFWTTNFGSLVGTIADLVIGSGRNLTADEVVAYAKGYSPKLIAPASLRFHAPIIRDTIELRGSGSTVSSTGTSVADHPRVLG